jgi:AraC-like DNA-binding protein
MWVKMSVIRDIIYAAAGQAADVEKLCKACGLSIASLRESEQRLEWEVAQHVWTAVVQHTADPLIGLHIGEHTHATIAGLLGHLMESSPDLKSAFQQLAEFQQYFTEMFRYQLHLTGKECILQFSPFEPWQTLYPDTARQAVDQAMAGSLHIARLLSRKNLRLVRADFVHQQKEHTAEYRRIFGENICFGQKVNQLIFSLQDVNLPLPGYHPELQEMFRRLLQQQLDQLKASPQIAAQVKKILLEAYQEGLPSLAEAADKLSMSPRSLQRNLKAEGVSYQLLSDEIRFELACKLLNNRAFRLSDIAFRLGYAETSVFRKAFLKWSGVTPSAYRAGLEER